ncbi:hypothetical protein As57867_024385, partial [Aphanomyces stellatus]
MARQSSQQPPQATPISARSISQGVALLENLQQQRKVKRARYSAVRRDEMDAEIESSAPVYDAFFQERGPQGIHTMTNFSPSEINILWCDVRHFVMKHWNVVSGRKCTVSPRDLLFMLLTSMKHCGSWDVVGAVFQEKAPSFEKRIVKFLNTLHPHLVRKYVDDLSEKWTMQQLVAAGQQFANHPFVRYATDVTFQQTNVPAASFNEKKLYFSKKHSLYGHKVEVSVLPNGLAINCTCHYKGSVSDTIFDENLDFHVNNLAKKPSELVMGDEGEDNDGRRAVEWAVIADKGYQGIQHAVRAVLPFKKPAGGVLTFDQERTNDRIATDRVIVENWFERLKTLWGVCADSYRWNRQGYDVVFQTCVALTNVHVRFNPLRASDGDANAKYLNRLDGIGSKMIKKKNASARTYRLKRKARLSLTLAAESAF